MSLEGTRRVVETTSQDTANQYLRFGWTLINQFVNAATVDRPATVTYVLASVRRLEDTRQVVSLTDVDDVNEHLRLGWKLIDKHVGGVQEPQRRDETVYYVLAWQSDDAPERPRDMPAAEPQEHEPLSADDLLPEFPDARQP